MKNKDSSNRIIGFGEILIGALSVSPLVGGFIALIYLDFYVSSAAFCLLWLGVLPSFGFGINYILGRVLFGDKVENSGYIYDGNYVWQVVKTPKYYTRRLVLCVIECVLFLLLIIRSITLMSSDGSLAFFVMVGAVVGIATYIMVGKLSYENSSIKEKRDKKSCNPSSKAKPSLDQYKVDSLFNFKKYPELLDEYINYKNCDYTDRQSIAKASEGLALAVFELLNILKPNLIIKKTGESVKWEDLFGKPYKELSSAEKLILVKLLDRKYKYVLPDKYYNL